MPPLQLPATHLPGDAQSIEQSGFGYTTDTCKARFTICRIAPSHSAASCPAAKIKMDSILATRHGTTGQCVPYSDPLLP